MSEETPWEKFQKKYDTKPWDLLNPNEPRVDKKIAESRMSICNSCEHLIQIARMCSKCGCYMPAKTTLSNAECPIEKWKKEKVENINE